MAGVLWFHHAQGLPQGAPAFADASHGKSGERQLCRAAAMKSADR
ncbi:hypothetical protein ACVIDN_002186 [Rhizobium brockwellii]